MKLSASGLDLGSDGVWYARSRSSVSYPDDGNACSAQVEDESFWFRHRNDCIVSAVRSFPPPGPIYDIGGGNGYVALGLKNAGLEVALVEPGVAGTQKAKQRGLDTVICSTLRDAGFSPASLPAVGLFDVVEHIEDDLGFLRDVHSLLTDGGHLYITVPSYSWLWSRDDELAGHYRRFTAKSLSVLLERVGFRVEFSTYIFAPLPFPIFLLRALPSRLGLGRQKHQEVAEVAQDHVPGKTTTRILNGLLAPEISLIKMRRAIPFGGSCLVAARK